MFKKAFAQKMTWYAIITLLVCVAILPILKAAAPSFFPESFDGFRDVDCAGVTCGEGQFCQQKRCIPIYVGGPVPSGNM